MPAGRGRRRRPRRATAPWRVAAALVVGGLSAALAETPAEHPADPEVSIGRGEALFAGREPLAGKIRDHLTDLPPAVVACGNCHRPEATALPNRAPALDRASLLTTASRRNGPPSAYDLPAFCTVLKTGIDPRSIMLARAMPLFGVDAAQCESLWLYLAEGAPR